MDEAHGGGGVVIWHVDELCKMKRKRQALYTRCVDFFGDGALGMVRSDGSYRYALGICIVTANWGEAELPEPLEVVQERGGEAEEARVRARCDTAVSEGIGINALEARIDRTILFFPHSEQDLYYFMQEKVRRDLRGRLRLDGARRAETRQLVATPALKQAIWRTYTAATKWETTQVRGVAKYLEKQFAKTLDLCGAHEEGGRVVLHFSQGDVLVYKDVGVAGDPYYQLMARKPLPLHPRPRLHADPFFNWLMKRIGLPGWTVGDELLISPCSDVKDIPAELFVKGLYQDMRDPAFKGMQLAKLYRRMMNGGLTVGGLFEPLRQRAEACGELELFRECLAQDPRTGRWATGCRDVRCELMAAVFGDAWTEAADATAAIEAAAGLADQLLELPSADVVAAAASDEEGDDDDGGGDHQSGAAGTPARASCAMPPRRAAAKTAARCIKQQADAAAQDDDAEWVPSGGDDDDDDGDEQAVLRAQVLCLNMPSVPTHAPTPQGAATPPAAATPLRQRPIAVPVRTPIRSKPPQAAKPAPAKPHLQGRGGAAVPQRLFTAPAADPPAGTEPWQRDRADLTSFESQPRTP